ncbi:hypothetical protein PUN28_010994 [Cardiocondyla obscurior]|uniref:Uncharacterized protein n=1 Tax=Cardiocondyla obscurior TaxID=286306 RepID=A0AAW2FLA4_9HYME
MSTQCDARRNVRSHDPAIRSTDILPRHGRFQKCCMCKRRIYIKCLVLRGGGGPGRASCFSGATHRIVAFD